MMCDSKVKLLLKTLADDSKRIKSVKSLVETFLNQDNLRDEIIDFILKAIASVGGDQCKGYIEAFRWILKSMDKKSLPSIILKMKEYLFLTQIHDISKEMAQINKIGSILTFDALLISFDITEIDNKDWIHFLNFVLSYVDDVAFGFLSATSVINYLTKIPSKQFKIISKNLKNELFEIENLIGKPQYLLLWCSFSSEQKKILRKTSKIVPEIQSKQTFDIVLKTLKMCKDDRLVSLLNCILCSSDFPVIWKFLNPSITLTEKSTSENVQLILLISFEVICPMNNGLIYKLSTEKQILLIQTIWGNQCTLKLFLKQLSKKHLQLHSICRQFVLNIAKIDIDKNTNRLIFQEFFNCILKSGTELINMELKIDQSLRLSNALLSHIDSREIYNNYINLLMNYFRTTDKEHPKIYVLEQVSMAFVKCPSSDQSVLELLLQLNYEYFHKNVSEKNDRLLEPIRAALLRCLEEILMTTSSIDHLRSLLICCEKIYENEDLSKICSNILHLLSINYITSKKRSNTERNQEYIDFSIKTNEMFLTLLTHLCMYLSTQKFDEEFLEMINDINKCFYKSRGISETENPSTKRRKEITSLYRNDKEIEESLNEDWNVVLTDALIIMLEQNCHYLRKLATCAFKKLVLEDSCNSSVLEHINMAIEDVESQIKNIDKNILRDGFSINEENDKKEDEEDDDEEDEEDDDEDDETDENICVDPDVKARISAAIGSLSYHVNSDSDDNCPEINDSNSSEDEEPSNPKTVLSLKEKRYSVLQLKQFRNRCIDFLEIVCLQSPRISDRITSFLILIKQMGKSNEDLENRLIQSMNSIKKFQPIETVSATEIINLIKKIFDDIQNIIMTKKILKFFSAVIVSIIRLNKTELSIIAESMIPIIKQCIEDRKKHSIKSIFVHIFNNNLEISWSFHEELLKYIKIHPQGQMRFYSIEILRSIVTNPSVKPLLNGSQNISFLSKSDILIFVDEFGLVIQSFIQSLNWQDHPKYAALLIGSLSDCLKLGGQNFYKNINKDILEKIKGISKSSISKDFKKILSQFDSVVDRVTKNL